jgi:hypothetical protein
MEQFRERDYKLVWDKFESLYKFNPSVEPKNWPGIIEPSPSFTISLTESEDGDYPESEAITNYFRNIFNELEGSSKIRYILDWCHTCYYAPDKFEKAPWVYPDGDYAICLNESMSCGTFGHPWEKTICIFGEPLIELTRHSFPSKLSRVIRENT